MNTYIAQIIQLLLYNGGEATFDVLMEQMHISKRMIDYYLRQFEEWRVGKSFPLISREDDKILLQCKDYNNFWSDFIKEYDVKDYFLSAIERQACIVLLIGISNARIKIEYLVEFFQVSKNTIANDLLIIRKALCKYHVYIENKGKGGYFFTGKECDIRYILMQCYHYHDNDLFHKYKLEYILEELRNYGFETSGLVCKVRKLLKYAEHQDNEKYYFLALDDLVETILLIACRMQKFDFDCKEEIPKKAEATMRLIGSQFKEIGINYTSRELTYLYLILQSAKVSIYNLNDFSNEVFDLINDIIHYFKAISQLNIFEQTEIYNMFLIHVKSMYFRTKYKIKITNFIGAMNSSLYGFYCIAEKVLAKVGSKYNLTYDKDEVYFLSYYFASLEQVSEPLASNIGNVLIICVSGLGSSMYLKTQCLKIFENSFTISICDIKNIDNYLNEDTKLIISTIDIDDKTCKGISLKRVHQVLTDKEKQELSEWFFMNRFSFNKESEMIHDVMDIVKECAVIKNQNKLFHNLNQYFNPINCTDLLHLKDIFSLDSITQLPSVTSLEQFIYCAGKPLLDHSYIKEAYLVNIIDVLNQHGPYCECFDGILVAHAVPQNDVECPCLSLCCVEHGFAVEKWNHKIIKAIFILGVTDTKSHCNAFSELIGNLTNDNLYERINRYDDKELLYKSIIKADL